jgi:beta-barrel assembly-enhancing protease
MPKIKQYGLPRLLVYPLLSGIAFGNLTLGSPHAATAIEWGNLIKNVINLGDAASISSKREVRLGESINEQMVHSQIRLYGNSELDAYVNEVGQRIAAHSDRPNIPYKYQVVENSSINAFATMGGFVYVHTGLLKAVDNEAQLASVLAHETGHINARHIVKDMQKQAIEGGLMSLAGVSNNQLANIGLNLAINKPGSRGHELEADRLGLKFLAKAGYPQSQMIEFMRVLLKMHSPPTFLSDHPGTPQRIQEIEKHIDPNYSETTLGMDSVAYKKHIHML